MLGPTARGKRLTAAIMGGFLIVVWAVIFSSPLTGFVVALELIEAAKYLTTVLTPSIVALLGIDTYANTVQASSIRNQSNPSDRV